MANYDHQPCSAEDLEVRDLSDHEWRVGDRRRDERSPQKVLGYIQRRGLSFEVMNIEAPRRHYLFGRWDAAIASFTAGSSH